MYPELLPVCSLKAKNPRDKIFFTKAEDNLLALGLKHFDGTEFPKPLISKYLLTTKTAHQLTVRIKNLNMNRAPDNIIKYYKKTKQLPVLFKCCEEIQPGEWKAPLERQEHRLPFWLKSSLPSLQAQLTQLAQDAGETSDSPNKESLLLRKKEASDPGCAEKYPLLLPKGLVLTLKPLANRFSRRAWRRQRSGIALKPLLIRPNPCVQPHPSTISLQKTAVKLSQSEAPPSKIVVQIPRLIQQPVTVTSVRGSTESFDFQSVLSTQHPTAAPQALAPLGFQPKMILPALATSKLKKPCVRRGYQKKRGPKVNPLIKAAPLIHPAPVIFTVPAAAVKVVSISNACNVLQPLNAAAVGGVTTLLVNPTSFPCPLSQPLVTNLVSPSSGLPAEDVERLNPGASGPPVGEKCLYPVVEPKAEPEELCSSCSMSPKEEHGTGPAAPNLPGQGSECCSWMVVETAGERAVEPVHKGPFPPVETVKMEPEEPEEANPDLQEMEGPTCSQVKEEQELDVDPTPESASEEREIKREEVQAGQALEGTAGAGGGSSESPKNASDSTPPEAESGSPLGKPEDTSSADVHSVGTPAGRDTGGEKNGQEEEEEEDFDDFTQDEEEEEMSSSSEESVLSVPELQFDGFEEVALPDVEEDDEPPKMHAVSKNKKRKEAGAPNHDKACESKPYKTKDLPEVPGSLVLREPSPHPRVDRKDTAPCKEPADESLEDRKTDSMASAGSRLEGKPSFCREMSSEGACAPESSLHCKKAGPAASVNAAKESPGSSAGQGAVTSKLPPAKSSSCTGGGDSEAGQIQRCQGRGDSSLGLAKDISGFDSAAKTVCARAELCPGKSTHLQSDASASPAPPPKQLPREGKPGAKRIWGATVRKEGLNPMRKNSRLQVPSEMVGPGHEAKSQIETDTSDCLRMRQQAERLGSPTVPPARHLREEEQQQQQQKSTEVTMCAKNSKVSSTGEKVVLWTREADRVILTTCQERGAQPGTFRAISQQLGNKTAGEVSDRFKELMTLFHTSCDGSSEEEEDATSTSNTEQLSDHDVLLSEEEQEEQ
uniref:GON-4-like protein n=1 Tax=Sphenodon punctatus TaxID=8508 RepID=A0A8D0HHR9_SPHPU